MEVVAECRQVWRRGGTVQSNGVLCPCGRVDVKGSRTCSAKAVSKM